jgi:hypothetical protein
MTLPFRSDMDATPDAHVPVEQASVGKAVVLVASQNRSFETTVGAMLRLGGFRPEFVAIDEPVRALFDRLTPRAAICDSNGAVELSRITSEASARSVPVLMLETPRSDDRYADPRHSDAHLSASLPMSQQAFVAVVSYLLLGAAPQS